jgi:hypothetical protein
MRVQVQFPLSFVLLLMSYLLLMRVMYVVYDHLDRLHLFLLFATLFGTLHPLLGYPPLCDVVDHLLTHKTTTTQHTQDNTNTVDTTDTTDNEWNTVIEPIERQLLEEADLSNTTDWNTVLSHSHGNFNIQLHKHKNSQFHFRLVASFESTPETLFDLLTDIKNRHLWDEMCAEAGAVERIRPGLQILYLKTKAFWPLAGPRDSLFISSYKQLKDSSFLNVTTSIPNHHKYTPSKNHTRMHVNISGQLISPDPDNPNLYYSYSLTKDADLSKS